MKRVTQTFHSVISRKLNVKIVVLDSELRKKLRPKLAKPKPDLEPPDAIPLANNIFLATKRQLDTNQESPLIPPHPLNPPLPAARLVQSKKMKSTILEDYQGQFGTG